MSTHYGMFSNHKDLYIYREMLDNVIHIEITAGRLMDIQLCSLDEWEAMGLPTYEKQMKNEKVQFAAIIKEIQNAATQGRLDYIIGLTSAILPRELTEEEKKYGESLEKLVMEKLANSRAEPTQPFRR